MRNGPHTQQPQRVNHEIWIFPLDVVTAVNDANSWIKNKLNTDAVTVGQLAKSGDQLVRQIILLGVLGDAYIKEASNGKKYIIFKGLSGKRPNLSGTRYLAENPTVSCFVVGGTEIVKDAAKATRVAVIAYVAIDIVQECLKDHFSLASLGVSVASDIAQAVISIAVGAVVGVLASSVAPVVVAYAIVVVVGFVVSWGLSKIDDEFRLTDRVKARIMALENDPNSLMYKIEHPVATARNELSQLASKGLDVAREGARAAGIAAADYVEDRVWYSIRELLQPGQMLSFAVSLARPQ